MPDVPASIPVWADDNEIDVVVWTGLPGNFQETLRKTKIDRALTTFSVDNAVAHIQSLSAEAKAKAAEYVWQAPNYVDTPVRRALQGEPWFAAPPIRENDNLRRHTLAVANDKVTVKP